MDAESNAAVVSVLREALLTRDGLQWDRSGADPRKGMSVAVFGEDEWRAAD